MQAGSMSTDATILREYVACAVNGLRRGGDWVFADNARIVGFRDCRYWIHLRSAQAATIGKFAAMLSFPSGWLSISSRPKGSVEGPSGQNSSVAMLRMAEFLAPSGLPPQL